MTDNTKKSQESGVRGVFNKYLELLRQGYVYSSYQDEALHMAKRWEFSTKDVEEATKDGFKLRYEQCINFIELGSIEQEKRARKIAMQYSFPIEPLENALKIGRSKN